MMTDDDLRDAWRRRPMKHGSQRADCLEEDVLVRLIAGEAGDAERQRAAGHLAICQDCAEEYRLLRPLEAWAADAEQVLSPSPARSSPTPSWTARLTPSRAVLALAAAILLLVAQSVTLYLARADARRERVRLEEQLAQEQQGRSAAAVRTEQEVAALRQRMAELSAPQINAPIVDVEPRDAVRGVSPPRTIELPKDVRFVTLVITAASGEAFPAYALQIVDESGRTVWEGTGLTKSAFGTFTLTVPAPLLPAGQLQLRLYGVRGEERQHLRDYTVRIQYQ